MTARLEMWLRALRSAWAKPLRWLARQLERSGRYFERAGPWPL